MQRGNTGRLLTMDDIIRKMNEINDLYEGMDAMLDEVDRNSTPGRPWKMYYLLNTDRSIKGKLVDIITAAAPAFQWRGRKLPDRGDAILIMMISLPMVSCFTGRAISMTDLYTRAKSSRHDDESA